jgi:PAS domain S-box-containing protein
VTYKGRRAVLSINRDVTERKRAEEAQRKEEQRRRLHVEQTPLGVIEWDIEFCVSAWNPGAARIFGYSAAEAIGRCARDFLVPPSAQAQVEGVWHELLASRGGWRSTNENVTKDGRLILCEWYNTPLVDADGHVVGVASLVQDVTASQRTRVELERSEKMYRTLAETVPAIVFSVEPGGQTDYCNSRWFEYTGQREMMTSTEGAWRDVMHPDDLDRTLAVWKHAVETTGGVEVEFRLRGRDGIFRWFLCRAQPLKDETGKVIRWLGTTTDIDHLKSNR